MATRASAHNGRAGKKGAYSARHNDRDFDTSTTDHIDPSLTKLNENVRFGGDFGAATNEQHELAFYREHFGESLDRKNAAYKAKGKSAQIKTLEQYYRSAKSCPEETLYTIGKDIDPQILWQIYREHQEWKAEAFPLCQTLSASLHVDEPNAMPHVHERSVWIGHDAQGMEVVGQAKALAEMGVLPPDPEEKYGKHNNAKQTFSRLCREHFVDLCRQHGLEIIDEPLPKDKVGLELTEYKIQRTQERLEEVSQELLKARESHEEVKGEVAALQAEETRIKGVMSDLEGVQADLDACEIPVAPVRFHADEVKVSKSALDKLQEQAKAYAVNKPRFEDMDKREKEAFYRDRELDRREESLSQREREVGAREAAVTAREKAQEGLQKNYNNLRASHATLSDQLADSMKEVSRLQRLLGLIKNALAKLIGKKYGVLNEEQARFAEAIIDVIGKDGHANVNDVLDAPIDRRYREKTKEAESAAYWDKVREEQEKRREKSEQRKQDGRKKDEGRW